MGATLTSNGRYGCRKQRCSLLYAESQCKRTWQRKLYNGKKCPQRPHRTTLEGCVSNRLSVFNDLFVSLESWGYLDPDNEEHIFCLQYVYNPVINNCLNNFSLSWSNHKIRTAGHKSPLEFFILGMQQIGGEGGTFASEYFDILDEVSTRGNLFLFKHDIHKSGSHSKSSLREEIHCMAKNYFHFSLAVTNYFSVIKNN